MTIILQVNFLRFWNYYDFTGIICCYFYVSEITNHSDQQTRIFFKRNIVMLRRLQANKNFVCAYKTVSVTAAAATCRQCIDSIDSNRLRVYAVSVSVSRALTGDTLSGPRTTNSLCLVDLNITPCISCLPDAREPEARPLGWLAL